MLNRHAAATITLVLLTTQLLACGGGGGGGDIDPLPQPDVAVALASKSDVVRELGNLVDFVALGAGSVEGKSAKVAVACNSGNADDQSGMAQHNFTLFSLARDVDYTVRDADNCRIDNSDGSSVTYDGVSEQGGSETGGDGVRYVYLTQGRNGSPASERRDGGGAFSTLSALGVIESALSSGRTEARVQIALDTNDSSGHSTMAQIGEAGEPLVVVLDGLRLTIDGPYLYSSTTCIGGAARVTTPSELTFGINGYPNGGELRISAGEQTAIVRINLDNSATVTLPDGSTQIVTTSEARAIFDNGGSC